MTAVLVLVWLVALVAAVNVLAWLRARILERSLP